MEQLSRIRQRVEELKDPKTKHDQPLDALIYDISLIIKNITREMENGKRSSDS